MEDTLLDGRRVRALTVKDNLTLECQIIEVDATLTGKKVIPALERVTKRTGYPKMITVDNGSKFMSKALDAWAYLHGVKFDFIKTAQDTPQLAEGRNAQMRHI